VSIKRAKSKSTSSNTSASAKHLIPRDLSWLAFNERVLQEARTKSHHIADRLKFLAIYSNNLDEFFRVRVASLHKINALRNTALTATLQKSNAELLGQIQAKVEQLNIEFATLYNQVEKELNDSGVYILSHNELTASQVQYLRQYYISDINRHITPLMIESLPVAPQLEDRSLYLACDLRHDTISLMQSYALIRVPVESCGRFIVLPKANDESSTTVVLLEEVIKLCLPYLFAQFGFNTFYCSIIKLTRNSEIDIDYEDDATVVQILEQALNKRKSGSAVRFSYDAQIDERFLKYLLGVLRIRKNSTLSPKDGLHNFKDFIDFPKHIFAKQPKARAPKLNTVHPLLTQPCRIMHVLDSQDLLLATPYHSFESIIDLMREASIDPDVTKIQLCAYRLAKNSAIISTLVNAARNGKQVVVILELRARFDERANLAWKKVLEAEGIKVFVGKPNYKIHAKVCLIERKVHGKIMHYSFISTGNVNERTSAAYADYCLLTSKPIYTKPVAKLFEQLQMKGLHPTKIRAASGTIVLSPTETKPHFIKLIRQEIKHKKAGKQAHIIVKLNSLSDPQMIDELVKAAKANVKIDLIIRGIFCLAIDATKPWSKNIHAVSIVDNLLEHGRAMYFHNAGKPLVFLSSADWMQRNLHYRVEATVQILDAKIAQQIIEILKLQLQDNVKARVLEQQLENKRMRSTITKKSVRSQYAIAEFLNKYKY
jgi:polyphosphate kinase